MGKKTTQCLKITASWTPHETVAARMMSPTFDDTNAEGMAFSSGRLTIKLAYPAKYDDPEYTAALTAQIQKVKQTLASMGEVHDFRVSAGAVENADVTPFALPDVAKAA